MITIRPARADDDFAAIAQLYDDTWQSAYHGMLPQAYLDRLTPATWRPETRWRNTLLAEGAGTLVGVCSFGPARQSDRAGWGELYSLYVHPTWQGQHVGTRLLQAAMARLTAHYARVYLVVLAANRPAQALYQAQGFTPTGGKRLLHTGFGDADEKIWEFFAK